MPAASERAPVANTMVRSPWAAATSISWTTDARQEAVEKGRTMQGPEDRDPSHNAKAGVGGRGRNRPTAGNRKGDVYRLDPGLGAVGTVRVVTGVFHDHDPAVAATS